MKYIQQLKNNLHLVIAFTVLVVVTVLSSVSKSVATPSNDSAQVEVDTVIPKGYVLVPLDLENITAISSVIQSYGIIDLYSGNPDGKNSKKIATRIKLIRAPYNPNLFAALVKEDLSERIMHESGLFYAVIQNKSEIEGSNELNSPKINKKIMIEYQH